MRGLALKFVLAPLALALVSCTLQSQEPSTQSIALKPCSKSATVQLVRLKATPWWNFWDKPSKAFGVCIGAQMKFVPLGADSGDLLNEMSGPLGTISSHISVPAS